MKETLSRVDNLFESPKFKKGLSGLQRAERMHDRLEGELYDYYKAIYKPPGSTRDEHDADMHIEYKMGQSSDSLANDDFDYEPEATRLKKLLELVARKDDEVQAELVALGTGQEIGEFATYGLKRHLRGTRVKKSVLEQQVIDTVRSIEPLDVLIRDNEGEVLTVISNGIYACRIGEGGISINEHGFIDIPKAKGTKGYGMGISSDMPELMEWGVHIDATDLDSERERKPVILNDWSDFLNVAEVFKVLRGVTIAIGDPVDGEPNIPEGTSEPNVRWYQRNLARTRSVGNAVVNGTQLVKAWEPKTCETVSGISSAFPNMAYGNIFDFINARAETRAERGGRGPTVLDHRSVINMCHDLVTNYPDQAKYALASMFEYQEYRRLIGPANRARLDKLIGERLSPLDVAQTVIDRISPIVDGMSTEEATASIVGTIRDVVKEKMFEVFSMPEMLQIVEDEVLRQEIAVGTAKELSSMIAKLLGITSDEAPTESE